MAVNVLHYYRMKAEFLPPELPSLGIYVRPGELAEHVRGLRRCSLLLT